MLNTPYQTLYSFEALGSYGTLGLRIEVTGSNLPDLQGDEIRDAAYRASESIKTAILAAQLAANPETAVKASKEREEILGLFDAPIYVEEIPNGYCSDYCCRHLPWFVVTTAVGRITIGWRKRVISIEWKDCPKTQTSDALFAGEDVTKGPKSIHAWSLEDAKRYVQTIIASAQHHPA